MEISSGDSRGTSGGLGVIVETRRSKSTDAELGDAINMEKLSLNKHHAKMVGNATINV